MADRTPLKTAHSAIAEDDPFAELTKIMGFDPRQKVEPQSRQDPVVADDFDIDLEKELMGEFGLDAAEEAATVVAAAPEAVATPANNPVSAHELDEAVAASVRDFDISTDDHGPHPAAPEIEFDRDFDDALTQSFDAGTDWPRQADAPAVAEEEIAAPAPEAVASHDFDTHFDEAMANVDMDFGSHVEPQAEPAFEPAAYTSGDPNSDLEAGSEAQAPEPVSVADPFEEIFALDRDETPAVAPAAEVSPPVAAREEPSLEDELNALLGNMGARISKPEVHATPHAWTSRAEARPAPAADPFAVAAVGYPAGQSAHSAQPHQDAAPAEAGAPVDAEPDIDAVLAQELAAAETGHHADAEAVIPVIDFDPADLEAFTRDDEAERAAVAAPVTPIFSRSWSRATPQPEVKTALADEPQPEVKAALAEEPQPQPVLAEEPSASAFAYQSEPDPAPAYEAEEQAEPDDAQPAAYDEVPDVETVDVPERVVALADDLDLPELAFEEDRPAPTAYDDLDAEFAGLLNDMNDTDGASVPQRSASYDDEPYEAGFKPTSTHDDGNAHAYAAHAGAAAAAVAAMPAADDFAATATDMRPFAPVESFDPHELDYDPELEEAMTIPGPALADTASQPRRRGLIAAAVVGAVVVIGGIGAFALSPGGGSDGAPGLVKADDAPIKVKPENPGGTVVPNQDNKVYEAVAKGTQPAAPTQQKLVADTQQPVNVNAVAPQNRVVDLSPDDAGTVAADDTAAPGATAPVAKSEDRIDPSTQQTAAANTNQDVALVSPRKVRTMIVKPDGTLAPREEPTPAAPQVAATEPADPAPQRVISAPAEPVEQTGAVPAAVDVAATAAQPAAEQPATAQPAAQPAAKAKANEQSAATPNAVAVAPQRPSDQPVDIVGEVKPDEVASISPTAASSGSWSMQIASQPSVDSAQSTYKDLARRYASVLEGQPVNIVKAEIAGKGTFYRVRVPANSRNDAIKLCESYKAAGGNCFVSK
jgi:hypothetical protein